MQQVYIEDMSEQDIKDLFKNNDTLTQFKHKDTAVFFVQSGGWIYAYDVEAPEEALSIDQNFYNLIKSHYNNFDLFINSFKLFEELTYNAINFFGEDSMNELSIRQMELWKKRDDMCIPFIAEGEAKPQPTPLAKTYAKNKANGYSQSGTQTSGTKQSRS